MPNKAIAGKLIQAWGHIGSIPKNGRNSNFNYSFVREEDAADALRHAFMKVGLSCIPSVEKVERSIFQTGKGTNMQHVVVTMRFTLTDQDSGESDSFIMVGEAMDVQDKALYKAITGCTKYAYVKLAMSGVEDNEDEDDGAKTDKPKDVPAGQSYRKPEPESKSATKASEPAKSTSVSSGKTDGPKPDPKPTTKPEGDKPVLPEGQSDVPTSEDTGHITAVIPAMKGKPATISFKPEEGIVYAIQFDAAKIDVPAVLKLQQAKAKVNVVCDITSGHPFLMHIQAA